VRDTKPQERTWAMACHMAALAGLIIPLAHVLGPLLVWLVKRNEMVYADDQGKEALNFQLSITVYMLVALAIIALVFLISLLTMGAPEGILPVPFLAIFLGMLAIIAIVLFDLVAIVDAVIRTRRGEWFRYPFTIRFIR
jgi:uncharacterized protein